MIIFIIKNEKKKISQIDIFERVDVDEGTFIESGQWDKE
jgi:hypothetical protein